MPGTVAGWADLLARHGTLPLADVLAAAIHFAGDGFPVHPVYGEARQRRSNSSKRAPAPDYLASGAAADRADRPLPGLARTLRAIAEGGADAFYSGRGRRRDCPHDPGARRRDDLEDLKDHRSTWEPRSRPTYRGIRVYECPPNGQGIAALMALNVAEGFDLAALDWVAGRLHLMIEAMRLAFADARQYVADPATDPAPVDWLLSEGYAAERRALIPPDAAMQPPTAARRPLVGHGLSERGRWRRQRLLVHQQPLHGLWLGHRAARRASAAKPGRALHARRGTPQRARAQQAPLSHDHPGDGDARRRSWASFGVMGGFMQPQGHLQMLST